MLVKHIPIFTVLLTCYILTACATLDHPDPQKNTSWEAPDRFSESTIYNKAFSAISQEDIQVSSNDRKTGVITAKKVVPLLLTKTPSEVPIRIVISKTGGHVTLSTASYLKIGQTFFYNEMIDSFYNRLFAGLNINSPSEKLVNKTAVTTPSHQVSNRTIKPKATPNALVKEMQGLLNDKGYNVGVPDGVAGAKTRSAVSSFQEAGGLPVSGILTSETVQALRAGVNGPNFVDDSSINLDGLETDNSSINLDDLETDDSAVNLDDL